MNAIFISILLSCSSFIGSLLPIEPCLLKIRTFIHKNRKALIFFDPECFFITK